SNRCSSRTRSRASSSTTARLSFPRPSPNPSSYRRLTTVAASKSRPRSSPRRPPPRRPTRSRRCPCQARPRPKPSQRCWRREANQRAYDTAHQQTEDALKTARDTKIPEFWKGREGEQVVSAVGVFLGGMGRAFMKLDPQDALKPIQQNIDQYYRQQKEKVDN